MMSLDRYGDSMTLRKHVSVSIPRLWLRMTTPTLNGSTAVTSLLGLESSGSQDRIRLVGRTVRREPQRRTELYHCPSPAQASPPRGPRSRRSGRHQPGPLALTGTEPELESEQRPESMRVILASLPVLAD